MSTLAYVAIGVFILNAPFGYWRAGAKTFSLRWFLGIHLPVPIVVAMRLLSGLGWSLGSFPVLIGAYFTGQFVGVALHRKISADACEKMK